MKSIILGICCVCGLGISAYPSLSESTQEFSSPAAQQSFVQSGDIAKEVNEIVLVNAIENGVQTEQYGRSSGCSVGCSSGCSVGCSSGCSVGCSSGCSIGCRSW